MIRRMFLLAMTMCMAGVFSGNTLLHASDMDTGIESAAKQTYVFKTFLKNDDIKIQSHQGNVVLTGTVSSEVHKILAKETLASMSQVKSVDDKLEVKGGGPAPYSDAWLIAKVEFTLLIHKNVTVSKTTVTAKDAMVTLRGEAADQAQKDLTTEYVKAVEGVKGVDNEMTVTAPMAAGKESMAQKMDTVEESVDDASITALAKMTLLYHKSTSALKTTVETRNGVVTLGGKAESAAEKELATRLVRDVHGVKNVVNTMTVE